MAAAVRRAGRLSVIVSRLAAVPNRQDEDTFVGGKPAVERHVRTSAVGHDQFPAPLLDRAADQGMTFQNHYRFTNPLNGLQRLGRIAVRDELEDPLDIGERPRTQPDLRHVFGRGRRALSPRARASR